MKFIVDAQLPLKLARFFQEQGFDCLHTLDLPKGNNTSDSEISELSVKESRIVISKDSDFYHRFLARLEPHKLLLVSTGNISTTELINLFDRYLTKILDELAQNSVVEITKNTLIAVM